MNFFDYLTQYSSSDNFVILILIKGERRLHNFNIASEAGGVGRALIRQFGTRVVNKTLEIRLEYTGGTSNVPFRGSYGVLVSAISVESGKSTKHRNPIIFSW